MADKSKTDAHKAEVQKADEQKAQALRTEVQQLESRKATAETALARMKATAEAELQKLADAQKEAHKPKILKASQIKNMLSPLIGFMPALMAAGDIVASAEKAEADIQEHEKRKAEFQKEIDDFAARKEQYEKQFLTARNAYHAEMDPLEQNKIKLKAEVAQLYTERDSLTQEIESVRTKGTKEIETLHYKLMKDLEADRKAFTAQIEQEKVDAANQLTKVKNDFAAFKSAHNLG